MKKITTVLITALFSIIGYAQPDSVPKFTIAPASASNNVNTTNPAFVGIYKSTITVDDSSPLITYGPNWATNPDFRCFGSTQHYTNVMGATASFTFTGNKMTVEYYSESKGGNMGVLLDGKYIGTINCKSEAQLFQKSCWFDFENGTHTATFINLDGFQIVIDAITFSK